MSFLDTLFKDNIESKYTEDLKKLISEFEKYLFYLFEKTMIVAEIKNKYTNISLKNRIIYQKEEYKKITTTHSLGKDLESVDTKKTQYFYYKSWVNKRLKRLLKILELDYEKSSNMESKEKDAENLLKKINLEMGKIQNKDDNLSEIHSEFKEIEKALSIQIQEIRDIYPIKDWTPEVHLNLFSNKFMIAFRDEIKITSGLNLLPADFNSYPAIIQFALNTQALPIKSKFRNLLEESYKFKKKKQDTTPIKVYHARTIYTQADTPLLFPLNTELKGAGFFVDLDPDETVNHVAELYAVKNSDILLYEITMPKFIFEKAVEDTHDDSGMRNKIENSYVFRPTEFPILNTYFLKNLIKVKMINITTLQ